MFVIQVVTYSYFNDCGIPFMEMAYWSRVIEDVIEMNATVWNNNYQKHFNGSEYVKTHWSIIIRGEGGESDA